MPLTGSALREALAPFTRHARVISRETMSNFSERVRHEFREALPPMIFFFISFHIVVFDRRLMLRQYGLPLSSVVGATIAALIVTKIVLIADMLPFVNRFPDRPLMYNVA
jgi:hypothetical protein